MHQFQLKFVRDFEADVWSRFWSRFVKLRYGRSLVEISQQWSTNLRTYGSNAMKECASRDHYDTDAMARSEVEQASNLEISNEMK